MSTSTPRHPLATFHNGSPRGQMLNFYYNGYFHMGLYGRGEARVVYRPTEVRPEGPAPTDINVNDYFHHNLPI